MIEIERKHLEALVAAASAGLMELADGLSDGTYEDDALGGIPSEQIEEAIETARMALL